MGRSCRRLTLGDMIERLATCCHRHRWSVLFAWVVVVIGVTMLAGAVGDNDANGGRLNGSDSDQADQIAKREFPSDAMDVTVVFHAPDGVAAHRSAIDGYVAQTGTIAGVDQATSPFDQSGQVSADGTTAFIRLDIDQDGIGANDDPTGALLERAKALQQGGVQVEFLGDGFINDGPPASEMFGILAAVFILLIAFGSVVAMGLPIITAIAGIITALGGVTLWSHVLQTPDFTTQVASMIGIGVGIDYALLIVTRYRGARQRGLDGEAAIVEAFGTAGRAVAFAGCTVMISLLGMLLMGMPFFHGLAIGTSTAVLVAVLAALTLLPALLGFAGNHIDRLSIHRRRVDRLAETGWHRWSRFVQRNPKRFAIGGFVVLVAAAAPVIGMRLAMADSGNDPSASTTRKAYDLLADGFGPGSNGPLFIVANTPDAVAQRHAVDLAERLATTPGVESVGPLMPSASGQAAAIIVTPTTSPQDERTEDLVRTVRDDVIPASGADAHVGGQTASNVDFADLMSSRLPIFIGAVLLLSFLLLLAVFRSVLVPLKAVVMNLLSIGAAYGVMVMVFQWGWLGSLIGVHGGAPIEPWAPMMLFAIVFGLSMDYEVFLLSAVKEGYDETRDNSYAVVEGLASTARVITAAAAIMVFVFGSFVLGDVRSIKLIGLGLAVAVLLDATIVRMVLVPATMELLGERNWWMPRWLDRVVPRLQVERRPAVAPATPTAESNLPAPETRARLMSLVIGWYRPLARARTWKESTALLLGLPFGIAWFVILVTGLSVSFGLLVTLIGIPLMVLTVSFGRVIGIVERAKARGLLDADLPAFPQPRSRPGDGCGSGPGGASATVRHGVAWPTGSSPSHSASCGSWSPSRCGRWPSAARRGGSTRRSSPRATVARTTSATRTCSTGGDVSATGWASP